MVKLVLDIASGAPPRGLHRLIYCSRQVFDVGVDPDDEIAAIIRSAIRNNRDHDVTGLLMVHQGWFVQVLEGPAAKLQSLYATIALDSRHADVTVISSAAAARREFGDWNMCARRINSGDEAILEDLAGRGAFEPTRLTGASALRVLRLVAQAQRRTAVSALV